MQQHQASLTDVARDLQIWGFPVVFAQRLRLRFTLPLDPEAPRPATSAGARLNNLGHQRRLSDPTLTAGVAPNVDTLYSLAFLDLDQGEFELRLPDFADRYYSVQIGEADSSTTAVLGQRNVGPTLPRLFIRRHNAGADDSAAGEIIECRSRFVMVTIRILVDPSDPDDVARVMGLQDEIELLGPPSPPVETAADAVRLASRNREAEVSEPESFVHSVGHAIDGLAADDIPSWVASAHHRLQEAITDTADPPARDSIASGLAQGMSDIASHVKTLGRAVNGWAINDVGTAFGENYLLRAAVAYSQIFINPAAEALYPVCEVDDTQSQLNGAHAYTLTFANGDRPPAAFFWSLTVYHSKGLLYENEISRYAITDRTPGLQIGPDGSLTIHLQNKAPSEGRSSNWLPCPPGDFRLMLRLYGPTNPGWNPPVVKNVN